jgi:hypothetical protein
MMRVSWVVLLASMSLASMSQLAIAQGILPRPPMGTLDIQRHFDFAWSDTGEQGDWAGRDFACTKGVIPSAQHCNAQTQGYVAVCWPNRRTGECGGATEWCTYKSVTRATRRDGNAPGRVWECK